MHVGRTLAERGIRLVYGGGSVGLMGILAEMIVRTYFESSGRRSYSMRETVNLRDH